MSRPDVPSRLAVAAGVVVVALAMLAGARGACGEAPAERVRPAGCADNMWYPADRDELARTIDAYLARARPPALSGRPVALISPHAGYRYAGPTMAVGYKLLQGQSYRRVIVLGISHRYGCRYRGGSILRGYTHYATPLGRIPVDRAVCDKLLESPLFVTRPEAHNREHSLENQLPFLQRVLGDFVLVPILLGRCEPDDYVPMAEAIVPFVDAQTLIVASSDFTHYGPNFGYFGPPGSSIRDDPPGGLKKLASEAVAAIVTGRFEAFRSYLDKTQDTICGRCPILLLLKILELTGGAVGHELAYDTSGRIVGDYTNSVTYVAIAFVRPPHTKAGPGASKPARRTRPAQTNRQGADARFAPSERQTLLRIARDALRLYLSERKRLDPRGGAYNLTKAMLEPGAAFVTLKRDGALRGCIGDIIARRPLIDCIVDNAINAATRDPRFAGNHVTLAELPKIHIEISVMSPLRQIDSPDQIVLGKHGVVLSRGWHRSVYLPQVATETGWSRSMFLSRLSLKAGLPADAWRQPGTKFEVFTAEVFGEQDTTGEGVGSPGGSGERQGAQKK